MTAPERGGAGRAAIRLHLRLTRKGEKGFRPRPHQEGHACRRQPGHQTENKAHFSFTFMASSLLCGAAARPRGPRDLETRPAALPCGGATAARPCKLWRPARKLGAQRARRGEAWRARPTARRLNRGPIFQASCSWQPFGRWGVEGGLRPGAMGHRIGALRPERGAARVTAGFLKSLKN